MKRGQIGVYTILIAIWISVLPVFGQSAEIIDKIHIESLDRLSVQTEGDHTSLNIVVRMRNENNTPVRFEEGRYIFYLGYGTNPPKRLGVDKTKIEKILGTESSATKDKKTDVPFKIMLGSNPSIVNNKLKRIINAFGDVQTTKPLLYIDGRFRVGVRSDKGWASLKAKIHWIIKPVQLGDALLFASTDIPEVPFPEASEDAFVSSINGVVERFIENKPALMNIQFAYNSAEIQPDSEKNLKEWYVAALNREDLKEKKLLIIGHTCDIGSAEYNQTLSEKRAQSVKEYFIKNGIDPARLKDIGKGESEPLEDHPNDSEENRKWNRRVEFQPVDTFDE